MHFSSKKFERMALEAMDICLQVLKKCITYKFDSYNRQEQCSDDIPCYLSGLSRAHFFDNFSRNSCISYMYTNQITDLKGDLNSRACQGTQARPPSHFK